MASADKYEREMEKCRCSPHDWVGRVHTDVSGEASVWVCPLASHREAAKGWVTALTGKVPTFTPAKIARTA